MPWNFQPYSADCSSQVSSFLLSKSRSMDNYNVCVLLSWHKTSYFLVFSSQSTAVVGFHLIISSGIQVRLSHGEETFDQCQEKLKPAQFGGGTIEFKGTEVFRAVAVGLCSMGIICSITYRCIPVYNIEEERTVVRIGWPGKESFQVKQIFEAMFTDISEGEFFSFFVNPYPKPER